MPEVKNRKGRGLRTIPKCPKISRQEGAERLLADGDCRRSWCERLEGDGQAVELEVDEVAGGVAGGAACGNVGAASLLDGNSDCEGDC